jgi:Protein of unknown function (DUF2393)
MGSIYQPAPEEKAGERYRPQMVAGAAILLICVVIFFIVRNTPQKAGEPQIDRYAEFLQTTDLHLSQAQNFVGGQVTYLEGKISNLGPKTVTGVSVQCVFRNSLGEVVDKPVEPVRVQQAQLGNPDVVSLSAAPLTPNASREFRIAFEHVSADWNQGLPELRIIHVDAK